MKNIGNNIRKLAIALILSIMVLLCILLYGGVASTVVQGAFVVIILLFCSILSGSYLFLKERALGKPVDEYPTRQVLFSIIALISLIISMFL